jgi:hypothetical protein
MVMKAIGYVRFSAKKQEEGSSIERQRETINGCSVARCLRKFLHDNCDGSFSRKRRLEGRRFGKLGIGIVVELAAQVRKSLPSLAAQIFSLSRRRHCGPVGCDGRGSGRWSRAESDFTDVEILLEAIELQKVR